jgi:hypothetical protein
MDSQAWDKPESLRRLIEINERGTSLRVNLLKRRESMFNRIDLAGYFML